MALPPINLDEYNARRQQNYEKANKRLLNNRKEKKAQIEQRVPSYFADPFNNGIPVSTEEALALSARTDPIDLLAQQTAYKQLAEQQMANALPDPTVDVLGGDVMADTTFKDSFGTVASPYTGIDVNPYTLQSSSSSLYTPAVTAAAAQSANNFDPANYPESATNHKFSKVSGPGKIFYRDKTPGYFQKDGHKNEVANNPGNIASKKNLYFGAIGRLVSKYNGEDHADSSLLVYPNAQAGFKALDAQMGAKSYNGPIKKTFAKWQKKGFSGKLAALRKYGIDTNKSYRQLSDKEKFLMRKVWAEHEGWRGKTY